MDIPSKVFITIHGFLRIHKEVVKKLEQEFTSETFQKDTINLTGQDSFKLLDSEKTFFRIDDYYSNRQVSVEKLIQKDNRVKLFVEQFNKIQKAKHNDKYKLKTIDDVHKTLIKLRREFLIYVPAKIKKGVAYSFAFGIYALCIFVDDKDFKLNDEYQSYLEKEYGISKEKDIAKKRLQQTLLGDLKPEDRTAIEEFSELDLDFEDDSTGVTYSVFYYSKSRRVCDKFHLKIFFDRTPKFRTENQEYTIIEKGFHEKTKNAIYEGYGYKLRAKALRLHIVLNNEKKKDKLKLILNCGDSPSDEPAMFGSLTGIGTGTARRNILSYEILAVKKTELEKIDTLENDIGKYFSTNRKTISINSDSDLNNLLFKKSPLNKYSWFVGTWKIWRFSNNNKKIIQSVMHVRNDYRVHCVTNQFGGDKEYNIQVCTMDVTHAGTLSISCMSYNGDTILSNMFFQVLEDDNPKLKGVMITVGRNNIIPKMRAFAMLKENSSWEGYFDDSVDDLRNSKKTQELIDKIPQFTKDDKEVINENRELYELLKESIDESKSPDDLFSDF